LAGSDARPLAVVVRALRSPRLARLLVAYLVFNLVEWGTWIALLVWAYEHDGVRGSSTAAIAQLVPAALFAPFLAGRLGRLGRGTALAVGYAAQGVTFLACAAGVLAGWSFAVVCALAAGAAVAISATRPIHYTALPEGAESAGELAAGNAASGTAEATAILAGPLLCGVLITPLGPGGVVALLGAACLLPVALTARLRPGVAAVASTGPGPRLSEVLSDPTSRMLSVLAAAISVIVGMLDILLVMFALDVLAMGESGPALLNSSLGLGGLLGAAATLALVGRQRLSYPVLVGGALTGLAIAVTGLAEGPVVAAVLIGVAGAGKVFFDVAVRTLAQRVLPERLLTGVFGLQESMLMAGLAVGSLAAPLVVHLVGGRMAFVVGGCFLPLVILVWLTRLRRVDDRAGVPADVLALLREVPILAVLAPRLLERVALDAVPVTAPAGSVVVAEGEAGDRFYVVADGEAAVTIGGREVRRIGPGGWFGELALLHDAPRSATVSAVTDLSLQAVERDSFLATVAGVPRSVDAAHDYARRTYS
jgi:MFS family permease